MKRFFGRAVPSHWSFISGFGSALVAIALAAWLVDHFSRQDTVPHRDLSAVRAVKTGQPWGDIEAQRIPLFNPDDIDLAENRLMSPPRWFFECSASQLVQYFLSSDLKSRERAVLLDQRYWKVRTNGCEIAPPESVVLSLEPDSRSRIYAVLATSPHNFAQLSPCRFSPRLFRSRLESIGFERFEIARLEHLAYTNNQSVCLADLGIAKKILSKDSFEEFMEMLYSTPAYTVRLRVTPGSDIAALAKYWGRGGREKQITPLLRSLANVPGGASINIMALLPEFARDRLFTFPDTGHDALTSREDCSFTAMNFFNHTADTNFLNPDTVRSTLLRDYEPVPPGESPTFGDVLQLADMSGQVFHMSIFLADDFVFTKNGVSSAEPWMIMKMQDMLTLYFANRDGGQVLMLRLKNPTPPPQAAPKRIRRLVQFATVVGK